MLVFVVTLGLMLAVATCVPSRWPVAQPETLRFLDGSPISCLLVESPAPEFTEAARNRGITVLAPSDVNLLPRHLMEFPPKQVAGTSQGLWPGIHVEKDGVSAAAPTGAPWIDTNAGFLRYVRAAAPSGVPVWIANRPPADRILSAQDYVHAIGDAAMNGARWVLDLQPELWQRLFAGDPKARAEWDTIIGAIRFYESNRSLCDLPDYSGLALVEDASDGALLSGGFLDMLAARHIPAYALPPAKLDSGLLPGLQMLLNVDPADMTPREREQATGAARRGATLVNGPPGWKVALPQSGAITFDKDQIKKLDEAWKEINSLVGRRNFGVRVFGAPGMLSNLKLVPGERRLVLHLLNYTNYPVESITIHFREKYKSARLLTPQGESKTGIYDLDEGSAVDIAKVVNAAILIVE